MLFERSKNGVVITASGERFCQKAQNVICAWEELRNEMVHCKAEPHSKLTVGVGTRVYTNHLMDAITAYFEHFPEIDVTFISDDTGNIWDDLQDGRLDVILDRRPPDNVRLNQSNIAVWELIVERSCFLISPDDPKSSCKELSYEDIAGYALVSTPEGSRIDENMKQDCLDYNIPMTYACRSNKMVDIMEMIRKVRGFLIGPESFGAYYHIAAIPKLPATYSALSFMCLKQQANSPLIKDFCAYLQRICAEK